jgi:two-component system cell cycle sensor histidine kinase/response regulator CckA
MEAIGKLSRVLAHDFNNQLMTMLGYADRLCEQLSGGALQDAQHIKNAAVTSASITRRLLDLSMQQGTKPGRLDINDLLRELQSSSARRDD